MRSAADNSASVTVALGGRHQAARYTFLYDAIPNSGEPATCPEELPASSHACWHACRHAWTRLWSASSALQ
eukprot:6396461-Pyramimonas_sp.AAC.1